MQTPLLYMVSGVYYIVICVLHLAKAVGAVLQRKNTLRPATCSGVKGKRANRNHGITRFLNNWDMAQMVAAGGPGGESGSLVTLHPVGPEVDPS